jgi:hypothetical protein
LAKGTKTIVKFVGIALVLLGVVMFILPYVMDAARAGVTCPANPTWCANHPAVVDYFWNGADIFPGRLWMYVAGMLVLGLVLLGASYALKD